MNILRVFYKVKKRKRSITDFYQESINRLGSEQFKRLTSKGLRVPVALL